MGWYRVLAAVLLASCGQMDGKEVANRVIFPASAATELLEQCSRDAPKGNTAGWLPTNAEIDQMESALPAELARTPEANRVDYSNLLKKWQRQYVGLIRDGRRFIYGNYFPVDNANEMAHWRQQPMVVCDGGEVFFGAEFDVTTKRITRIDFNGGIGG